MYTHIVCVEARDQCQVTVMFLYHVHIIFEAGSLIGPGAPISAGLWLFSTSPGFSYPFQHRVSQLCLVSNSHMGSGDGNSDQA